MRLRPGSSCPPTLSNETFRLPRSGCFGTGRTTAVEAPCHGALPRPPRRAGRMAGTMKRFDAEHPCLVACGPSVGRRQLPDVALPIAASLRRGREPCEFAGRRWEDRGGARQIGRRQGADWIFYHFRPSDPASDAVQGNSKYCPLRAPAINSICPQGRPLQDLCSWATGSDRNVSLERALFTALGTIWSSTAGAPA